jgi:hypothetical protein
LQEFLQKAGGQLKGIDESIGFTRMQVDEEINFEFRQLRTSKAIQ